MRGLVAASVALLLSAHVAQAEPFKEVTIGVPVASIADAEAWYANLFGADAEVMKPVPGIVEYKISSGVWYQIFEVEEHQPSASVVRFMVDDMAAAQAAWSALGIDTGEAIEIPEVVTYSEFTDPDGNSLGLYALP